jgi:protein involved in polysaccharide export with SLBB domain
MTIRSAFERLSGSKEGLSHLRIGMGARWLPIALALALVPRFLPGQVTPGSIGTQATGAASTSAAARSAFPLGGGASAPVGYVLSPNDYVGVEVFGEDDLRTNGRLNPEGNLSVPLLGSVHLAGLTLTQAASRLTELYGRDYLVNPKVNVMLLGYAKRRFSILGQVGHPGSFEMPESSPGGIDLLEAIAMAGGYTRIAAPERITVRRQGPNGDQIFKVNAKKFTKGSGGSFLVQPGDTITVGESIF